MGFLSNFYKNHYLVIMVGGSGLYAKAITHGIDNIPSDKKIRHHLNEKYKSEGLEPLKKQLQELDSFHFNRMDIENPQRVIRALEVCLLTGKTYSSFRNEESKTRDFKMGAGIKRLNKSIDKLQEFKNK